MTQPNQTEQSARTIASLVTGGGLLLVWAIVWANVPPQKELLAALSTTPSVEMPRQPELDLTIPGVPRQSVQGMTGAGEPSLGTATSGEAALQDSRARQIAEVRCEAEIQHSCPDSLMGEGRQRCMIQRLKRLNPVCQQIVRQRLVRSREAEGSKVACAEDVTRFCRSVEPGDGRILQCLQEHEQDLSEACYQSLPKGRLHFRN